MLIFIGGLFACARTDVEQPGATLMIIGAFLDGVAWSASLRNTARRNHWLWFIVILFLFPLSPVIYGALGPD